MFRTGFILSALYLGLGFGIAPAQELFRDPKLSTEQRVNDLSGRLTLKEKVMLLGYRNAAIDRLHIPAYNWWSEGLHGVARAGVGTVFPQAIGLAATFDPELMARIGDAISTEARAKNQLATEKGNRGMYVGLTYWSPNINIFRDPRWGRGQETYGEDPYLTATMGMAYVRGMQGADPNRLKIAAAAKHFVAHSGPEKTRDNFNAKVTLSDLHDTYLYAFKKLARGGVAGIMTAYNEVNGIPNTVNETLLRKTLIDDWGYKGYVVTDCGALDDVFATHHYINDPVKSAASALHAGVNLDCSDVLQECAGKALEQGLIAEAEIDAALRPLLTTEMKLGFFDPADVSAYRTYREDSIHNAAHIALAREAAQKSIVLLKNDKNILPLHKAKLQSVMVLGPNAASADVLLGSYHGMAPDLVTFAEGIAAAVEKGTRVEYDPGAGENDTTHFGGIWAAGNADVTVAIVGLSPVNEGEAGDAFLSSSGGDRTALDLPASHLAMLRQLRRSVKTPVIAVVTAGSAVNIDSVAANADAVLLAWYPGEQGGAALADILFGAVNPSGKLPVTFYHSINDLPAFEDYGMRGRTYRYYTGSVAYPFGYGLSYTTFDYADLHTSARSYHEGDTIEVVCTMRNTGSRDGDEVVQAYVGYPTDRGFPIHELKGFARVSLPAGSRTTVNMRIPVEELKKWDQRNHAPRLFAGEYKIILGGQEVAFLVD